MKDSKEFDVPDFQNRPALIRIRQELIKDCSKDQTIIEQYFTGKSGAEIGRLHGISRERVRQRLNRVFESIKTNPYIHTCLYSQQIDNLIEEFNEYPSIDLYKVYSNILNLLVMESKSFPDGFELDWIPVLTIFHASFTKSQKMILVPVSLIKDSGYSIVECKKGVKKINVPYLSFKRLIPHLNIIGFFEVRDKRDEYILSQIPKTVIKLEKDTRIIYIRPHQVQVLEKKFLFMLHYYKEMVLTRVVLRLQELMQHQYPKGEWSLQNIELYIRSIPGVIFQDGLISMDRTRMKIFNFHKIYSSKSFSKKKQYQIKIADVVNQGNASSSKIIREVFDGDQKLMYSWFQYVITNNPLILLETIKTFDKMNRYKYLSLGEKFEQCVYVDYGKDEKTVIALFNSKGELEKQVCVNNV